MCIFDVQCYELLTLDTLENSSIDCNLGKTHSLSDVMAFRIYITGTAGQLWQLRQANYFDVAPVDG